MLEFIYYINIVPNDLLLSFSLIKAISVLKGRHITNFGSASH